MRILDAAEFYTRRQTKRLFALKPASAPAIPASIGISGIGLYSTAWGLAAAADLTLTPGASAEALQGYELEFVPPVSAARFYTFVPPSGSHHITGLDVGTVYQVRARAIDFYGGASSWSSAFPLTVPADTAAPAKPSIQVTAMDAGALIKITSLNAESDFLCYVIDRANNSQFTGAVEIVRTFSTAWHDRSVPSDGLYFYRVRAIDKQGNLSAPETFGPIQLAKLLVRSTAPAAPPPPTNVVVSDTGGALQVSWQSPFISNLASIRIWRRTSTGAWSVLVERASNPNSSEAYTDTAIQPGVTYFYSLQSLDTSGLESAFDPTGIGSSSAFTSLSSLTLSATPGAYQDVVLTWNYPAATPNEPFEPVRFDLQRQAIPSGSSLPNSTDWDLVTQAYKTTRYRDTGLEPNSANGVRYIYQLTATDKFNRSVSTQSGLISVVGAASAGAPVDETAAGDVVVTAVNAVLDSPDINGNQRLLVSVTMTPPSPIGTFHGVDLYRARPDTAYPQYIGYFPYTGGTWTVTFSDDSPASSVTDRVYAVSCTVGGKKNTLTLYSQPSPTPSRTYSAGGSPSILAIPSVTSPGLAVSYVEDSADILAELTVSYTAPNPLGSGGQAFEGVQLYISVDGILEDFGWRQFSGVPGAAVSFPVRRRPPLSDQNVTAYLVSRNQTRQNPLNLTSTPHAQVFVLANPYPSGAGLVTSFAASAVYDVSESGDDVYGFTGSWALPVDVTNYSKTRIVARNLTYPSTPDIPLGDYDYPTVTFQTDLWPVTETIQYKLFAVSCASDGTPNAINGSTPNVTLTIQPQVGSSGQERAPNVTGFTASVAYGATESGDDGYRFQGGFTFPVNVDKFRGAVIVARKAGSPDSVLTGVLFGPSTTPTFQTQFFPAPSGAETWDLYAVSVDANNRQNSITGSTPKVTVTVQPQVGTSGQERAPLVTGFTASVFYALTESGDEGYGFQGNWTNPTNLSKFRGVKIIARIAGANDRVLAEHSFGDTTFSTDVWPVPNASEAWTLYAVSTDANNRANTITGATPSVNLTVVRQGNSATTGLENAPNITSPVLTPVYSVTESGDERYQFTGSFTLPSPLGRYRGLRVIGKVGTQFYEFTTLGASVNSFATDYAPVPFAPQSMRVYFVSIDANNRTNSISDAVTPYIDVTIQRQGNSVSAGLQVAPVVTAFTATINYSTSVDGVEMYSYSGSWTLPVDQSRFRGVKIYEATNPANESTWIELAKEGDGSTSFKTDSWPVPSSPRTITLLAISVDANNRENDYQLGVTPAVSGTVQTGGTGSLNMTRVNSTTLGYGLGQDGSGRLRSTNKAENAVSNPDFEYGTKDWTLTPPGSISIDSTSSYSGTNSLKIDFTGLSAGSVLVASDFIPVRPGDKYVMSAYVKQSGETASSIGQLRLYQRDKSTPSTGLAGAVNTSNSLRGGTWGVISTGVVTIPADCYYVRACPCTTGSIPGGLLWIDSVVVVRVPDETFDSSLTLQGSGTGTRMGVNTGIGIGRNGSGAIAATSRAENVLSNGDFEFDNKDWNFHGNVVIDTTPANVFSGAKSVKLTHPSPVGFTGVQYASLIPCRAGDKYVLTTMIRHSGENGPTYSVVNFMDASFTYLGGILTNGLRSPGAWGKDTTGVFTVPAGAMYMQPHLIWSNNDAGETGTVWLDSATLTRVADEAFDSTIAVVNSKLGVTDNSIVGIGLAKDPSTGVLTANAKGQNLATNGDFEAGLKDWQLTYPQYCTIDSSFKYSGSKSLKLDLTGAIPNVEHDVMSPMIPARPGEQFRMTSMVYQSGNNGVVTGLILFYAADGSYAGVSYTNQPFNNGAWTKMTTNIVTAPPGTVNVRFFALSIYTPVGSGYTNTGQVWLDSVVCERLSVDVFESTEFQITGGFVAVKNVNLAKAINFSTEFEVSSGALRMKELAAEKINTGILSVGGGGSKVSKFAIFNTLNQAIGWIGVDSGYEGAWFKRILIGGTAPASAKIVFDALGNGAITGDLITGTLISATISSNNITTGTLIGSSILLNSAGITTSLNNQLFAGNPNYSGISVRNNSTGNGGYLGYDFVGFYTGAGSLRGILQAGAQVQIADGIGNYFYANISTGECMLSLFGNLTGFRNGYFVAGNFNGLTATFKAYDPVTFNPVTVTVKGGIVTSIV